MKKISFLSILIIAACSSQEQQSDQETYSPPSHHTEALTKVFNAHGGYENWSQQKSLSYNKGDESTLTDLQNRKILLQSSERTIGFDGTNVWIAPDSLDAGRARFYHNLYFYFFAMPFVVGDPGAYYEELPQKEINGRTYGGIKVSYNQGVGDAPDDNYIIWYDPETFQMEWLMYTVTYRSGEPSDRYSLIKYENWQNFSGTVLPQKIAWYQYQNDSVGDMRSEAIFENIELSKIAPDSALFAMPDNAKIAPR